MKISRHLKLRAVILLAVLLSSFFFLLPVIADWIVSQPVYAKYAQHDAPKIVNAIQRGMMYPVGSWLDSNTRYWIVMPYYLLIFCLLSYVLFRFFRFWKWVGGIILVTLLFLFCFPNTLLLFEDNSPSVAYGSVAQGRIEHAKRMYYQGDNFTTYSFLCYLLGRTHVHENVRAATLASYAICKETVPGRIFVIGETGHADGGYFPPHRTHRNGMSVDFMTPLNKNGKPYLSRHFINGWGYLEEFDNDGKDGDVAIDFEAMAKHLSALEASAKNNNLRIQKVIFDPVLRPHLFATPTGKKLKHLPWTKNRVIIRHDDHYHVDFVVEK